MDTKPNSNTSLNHGNSNHSPSRNMFPERDKIFSHASTLRSHAREESGSELKSSTELFGDKHKTFAFSLPRLYTSKAAENLNGTSKFPKMNAETSGGSKYKDDGSGAHFGNSVKYDIFSDHNEMKQKSSSLSFIARIAQNFSIFRSTPKSVRSKKFKLNGIFKHTDRVDDFLMQQSIQDVSSSFNISSKRKTGRKRAGTYKTLIISSTPAKFQSIDPNSVFNAKRQRTKDQSWIHCESRGALSRYHVPQYAPNAIESNVAQQTCETNDVSVGPGQYEAVECSKENGDYFCSPPLEKLATLTPLELNVVTNFIVGRVGFGNISFDFPVNLSTIFADCSYSVDAVSKELFGRIIKIEDSVVRVYDGTGMASPDIGQELNVPATITLKAHPRQYSTEDHIKRLQNKTDMEFITYDPSNFNWTFRVQHFSVWGLIDDGEDDADENVHLTTSTDTKKKQIEDRVEVPSPSSELYQNENYQSELKRQRIDEQLEGIPGGWNSLGPVRVANKVLSDKQNLVQYEINREVNLFKEKKVARMLAANISDITSESENENNRNEKDFSSFGSSCLHEDRNYDYLKGLVVQKPSESVTFDLVHEKAYEPSLDGSFFSGLEHSSCSVVSKDWLLELELANTVDSALAPFLIHQTSQQSNLNFINEILFSDTNKRQHLSEQAFLAKPRHQGPHNLLKNETVSDLIFTSESLESMIFKTDIMLRANGFPKMEFVNPLNFAELSEIFKISNDCELLKLASVLFNGNQVDASADCSVVGSSKKVIASRLRNNEVRSALASWLKLNIEASHANECNSLDDLFFKLCSGDIKAAVSIALTSGNQHIAALLSLLGSNDQTVRQLACSQIERWEKTGALIYVPLPVQNIFRLLAWHWDSFRSKLPGKVLFALRVFYGNPAADLSTLYADAQNIMEPSDLVEMLRIYTSLQEFPAEASRSTIAASSLSSSLKWLLALVLSSQGDSTSSFMSDTAILSFGDELEHMELWAQAIYVYSSIKDDDLAERAIRNLIIGNIDQIVDGEVGVPKHFINTLKVPSYLIHEAQAVQKCRIGDTWGSAEEFMAAYLWQEAHNVICDKLGPIAVIEESPVLTARLMRIIAKFPEGHVLPGWNSGAGFYARYFDILETEKNQMETGTTDILFLLDNVANLQGSENFELNVAKDIITRKIGNIALQSQKDLTENLQKLTSLSMGELEKSYLKSRLIAKGLSVD